MAKSYHISFNGTTWTEFFPANAPKITLEQEAGEIFMRNKVDTFRISGSNNTVYSTLETYFFDSSYFSTIIEYKIQKEGVDKYFFRASVNDGKIDTERQVYEISPSPDDEYKDILDVYDKTFIDTLNIGVFGVSTSFLMLERDESQWNQNGTGWSYVDNPRGTVTYSNSSGDTKYGYKDHAGDGVNGYITKLVINNFAGSTLSAYLGDAGGTPLSNTVSISADGVYSMIQNSATDPDYVIMEVTDGKSGSFDYIVFSPDNYSNGGGDMQDVIERLLSNSSYMNIPTYSGNVVSTYLWNDTLETDAPSSIDTYITANPTNDYVTESTAVWNNLLLAKMDVFTEDDVAQYDATFKDLMDFLKIKLRAWWFLDSDNKFRIEHEKYFRDYSPQIDVTTATYSAYKPEIDNKEFFFDKGDLASTLNYTEQNASNADFVAKPIIYDPEITDPKSRDIRSPLQMSTDAEYIVATANSVQNEGFALFQCGVASANYYVDINNSYYDSDEYYVNQRLSWAHLFDNYFGYFAEANTGFINNSTASKSFDHVKEFLHQDNISFYYSGELDWYKPLTTSNGTAWIRSVEESENELLTIKVGYDPYA